MVELALVLLRSKDADPGSDVDPGLIDDGDSMACLAFC